MSYDLKELHYLQIRDDFLRSQRIKRKWLRTTFSIAAAVFGAASAFLTSSIYRVQLNNLETVAALIAGVGLSVTVATYILIKSTTRLDVAYGDLSSSIKSLQMTFISLWAMFEKSSNHALGRSDVEPLRTRELMSTLLERELIDGNEFELLKRCLRVRNEIAHGETDRIEIMELNRLVIALSELSEKIMRRGFGEDKIPMLPT